MRTHPTRAAEKEEGTALHAQRQAPAPQGVPARTGLAATLLALQRTHGNRFVQRFLAAATHGDVEAAPEVDEAIQRTRGGGQALPSGVRHDMESAFGADFSGVHIHTDGTADALNRSLTAVAFTTGQDVYFRQGEYDPEAPRGRGLLAHELTHVVQQAGSAPQGKLVVGPPDDLLEQEADRTAHAVMQMPEQAMSRRSSLASDTQTEAQSPSSTLDVEDLGMVPNKMDDRIVFASGRHAPGTQEGGRLPAHELGHVLQQASSGPLMQRAPDLTEADALTPEVRTDTQKTINLWRTQANQCVLDTAAWYADNFGQFISLTSSNSTLSWTNGTFFKVFEATVGWAVGKAVGSLAGAMLGAEIGSIAGPPGIIAGFVVGKVAGEIVADIIGSIKGPDQVKAQNAAQAGQGVNASGQAFFQQATNGQNLVTSIFQNAQKNLDRATTASTVFTIRAWALQEIAAVKAPPKGDRSLFQQMYGDWVLEHSQGTRLPVPNIEAGEGVDPAQWQNAVKNAPPVGGVPVANHIDLFGYQMRGFLSSRGIAADKGQEMIDAAQGATSQDVPRLMRQFDGKTFVFATGDPQLLSAWLAGKIGWQQDSDPVSPQDVTDGKVKVSVTPNLFVFPPSGLPPGCIAVTAFDVSATVPDRYTYKSSDPMDAGLPTVVTERGPKTYQLGKITP